MKRMKYIFTNDTGKVCVGDVAAEEPNAKPPRTNVNTLALADLFYNSCPCVVLNGELDLDANNEFDVVLL